MYKEGRSGMLCRKSLVQREPHAGVMNSFMVPQQSVDACWNFYHYHVLKEHCQVSGTFQRKQQDQLRPNPCPGVHGWDRRKATCSAESVQFHKCACVAKGTQRLWVVNSAWRGERKLCTETRTHECWRGHQEGKKEAVTFKQMEYLSCGIQVGVGAVHDLISHKGLLKIIKNFKMVTTQH